MKAFFSNFSFWIGFPKARPSFPSQVYTYALFFLSVNFSIVILNISLLKLKSFVKLRTIGNKNKKKSSEEDSHSTNTTESVI